MKLKLKTADDLDKLGIDPAVLTNLKARLRATPNAGIKCPSLGHLIEQAKSLRIEIRKQKANAHNEACYLTALHWRYGMRLKAIKKQCKHGEWLKKLVMIGEVDRHGKANRRRAREYIRYTQVFTTEANAGKKTVDQANKLIKRHYNSPFNNCFATPDWLRDEIAKEFGFPGLDVCSSHGMHFGDKWFSPKDNKAGRGAAAFDGLAQDWSRFCPQAKIIFCNPPFKRAVLSLWMKKCWEAAQTGYTVVCVLPQWARDGWYQDYVAKFGEVRHAVLVEMKGFGPKKGIRSGGQKWETLVVVFRKDQMYSEGPVFRKLQPNVPPLATIEDQEVWQGVRQAVASRLPRHDELVSPKTPMVADLPVSLGRLEVINRLTQALNQLDLAGLAHWWRQMMGQNYCVEGDRLVKCDSLPNPTRRKPR
jgi:hypothetical protein